MTPYISAWALYRQGKGEVLDEVDLEPAGQVVQVSVASVEYVFYQAI
jgi:hypothetical protein